MSDPDTPPPPSRGWLGVELRQAKAAVDNPKFTDAVAKTLAGGYVFVGFILTTIAAFQGGLERLLLNHPWWTLLGLLLTGAGIALGFVDAFVKSVGDKKWVIGVALVLFAIGLGILMRVSTKSLGEAERPEIAASASMVADGSKLEGDVTAFGIKTDQWVYVSATGFVSADAIDGVPLYKTRAGPSRNGKVELSFAIPVAFNHYHHVRVAATRVSKVEEEKSELCFESQQSAEKQQQQQPSEKQSCATVFPPHGPERPTLSATLEKTGTTSVLNVTAKASGVDPDNVIFLYMAVPGKEGKAGTTFYRSMLSSSPAGLVDATAKAPVPSGTKKICVVGTAISAAAINAADYVTRKKQLRKLRKQLGKRTCTLGSLDLSKTSFVRISVP